jgi:uncharacterized protein (DUF2249 family)
MEEYTPLTIELDVRDQLRKKLEPFQLIMETVKTLRKEDTFVLHATFKPTPLLGLMRTKGFVNQVKHVGGDHWTVTFVHKSRKHEIASDTEASSNEEECDASPEPKLAPQTYELDNRGLEPPQPMIRTLKKLEEAQVGDHIIIHNDRVPMFLIEELNTLGYKYDVEGLADGSARVSIHKT